MLFHPQKRKNSPSRTGNRVTKENLNENNIMKKLFLCALAALCFASLPLVVAAQTSPEEKSALYTKWFSNRTGEPDKQKIAFEAGKEYLQKYGSEKDQYVDAVQRWVSRYEEELRKQESAVRLGNLRTAFTAKDYAKAFNLGREILRLEPESLPALAILILSGVNSSRAGNASFNAEATALGRRALQLLDENKIASPDPFKNLDDARAFVSYNLGFLLRDSAPVEAAPFIKKAVTTGETYKEDPAAYFLLGATILNGEYQALANEYREKFAGKDQSPEQQEMLGRLKALSDRMLDAFARAVALAAKPEQKDFKAQAMAELTRLYKELNNDSDAGLNDLIAGVLAKPVP